MRSFHFGENSYFCQKEDAYRYRSPKKSLELGIELFTRRRMFREVIASYASQMGQTSPDYAVVQSCGGVRNKIWSIKDNGKLVPLQEIIDGLDGLYTSIILCSCNCAGATIDSRRSLIIHPANSAVSEQNLERNLTPLRLHMPGHGYIENNYDLMNKIISAAKNSTDENDAAVLQSASHFSEKLFERMPLPLLLVKANIAGVRQ